MCVVKRFLYVKTEKMEILLRVIINTKPLALQVSIDTVGTVIQRLYETQDSQNFQALAGLISLGIKMKRENFLLYDISAVNDVDDHWNRYRDCMALNILPFMIQFGCNNALELHEVFNHVIRKWHTLRKKIDESTHQKMHYKMLDIICDNIIDKEKDLNIIQTLNSPKIWKYLLDSQSYDVFVYFMSKYINEINLTKLNVKTKDEWPNNITHPICQFFASQQTITIHLSKFISTVLYPNETLLSQFYQNNDKSITNMDQTLNFCSNISAIMEKYNYNYKDTNDEYYDVWNDIDKFDEFVNNTMNKSLFSSKREIGKKRKTPSLAIVSKSKSKLQNYCSYCISYCRCSGFSCCACNCSCSDSDCLLSCVPCHKKRKDEVKYDGKKILLLGTGASGKSTIFKQIKDILHFKEDEKQTSEKESAKEEAKGVIRMRLIAEISVLIARAIMYHHDAPEVFVEVCICLCLDLCIILYKKIMFRNVCGFFCSQNILNHMKYQMREHQMEDILLVSKKLLKQLSI